MNRFKFFIKVGMTLALFSSVSSQARMGTRMNAKSKGLVHLAGGITAVNPSLSVSSFSQNSTVDRNTGNAYFVDGTRKVIWKVSPAGDVTVFAGILNSSGCVAGGPGVGRLTLSGNSPIGIDTSGNVYVGDGTCGVRKITPDGTLSASLSPGLVFFVGNQLAIDSAGQVYFAFNLSRIYRLATNGTATQISSSTQSCQPETTPTGALSALALNNLRGMTIDAANIIYISDCGRIIRINTANLTFSIQGGSVTQGTADGTGTGIRFGSIGAGTLAYDYNTNALYASDAGNATIRKITNLSASPFVASSSTPIGEAGATGVQLGNLPGRVSGFGVTGYSPGRLHLFNFYGVFSTTAP